MTSIVKKAQTFVDRQWRWPASWPAAIKICATPAEFPEVFRQGSSREVAEAIRGLVGEYQRGDDLAAMLVLLSYWPVALNEAGHFHARIDEVASIIMSDLAAYDLETCVTPWAGVVCLNLRRTLGRAIARSQRETPCLSDRFDDDDERTENEFVAADDERIDDIEFMDLLRPLSEADRDLLVRTHVRSERPATSARELGIATFTFYKRRNAAHKRAGALLAAA